MTIVRDSHTTISTICESLSSTAVTEHLTVSSVISIVHTAANTVDGSETKFNFSLSRSYSSCSP